VSNHGKELKIKKWMQQEVGTLLFCLWELHERRVVDGKDSAKAARVKEDSHLHNSKLRTFYKTLLDLFNMFQQKRSASNKSSQLKNRDKFEEKRGKDIIYSKIQKQRKCIQSMKAILSAMKENQVQSFSTEEFNKVDQLMRLLESAFSFVKEQMQLGSQSILYHRHPHGAPNIQSTLLKFKQFCTPKFLQNALASGTSYNIIFHRRIDSHARSQLVEVINNLERIHCTLWKAVSDPGTKSKNSDRVSPSPSRSSTAKGNTLGHASFKDIKIYDELWDQEIERKARTNDDNEEPETRVMYRMVIGDYERRGLNKVIVKNKREAKEAQKDFQKCLHSERLPRADLFSKMDYQDFDRRRRVTRGMARQGKCQMDDGGVEEEENKEVEIMKPSPIKYDIKLQERLQQAKVRLLEQSKQREAPMNAAQDNAKMLQHLQSASREPPVGMCAPLQMNRSNRKSLCSKLDRSGVKSAFKSIRMVANSEDFNCQMSRQHSDDEMVEVNQSNLKSEMDLQRSR